MPSLLAIACASSPNPRYYGFYWAESKTYGAHLAEVAQYTNLNFVQQPEDLAVCARLGVRCILEARWQFFGAKAADGRLPIVADHERRFLALARAVEPHRAALGAFYVIDEPYWNGVSPADLATAMATIRARFPSTPILVVFAAPSVNENLVVPREADWVGFDRYESIDRVRESLAVLEGRLHPRQRVFLVPQGFRNAAAPDDSRLAELQSAYETVARANPRVIGLLVFGRWTHERPEATPRTTARQREIGERISRGRTR